MGRGVGDAEISSIGTRVSGRGLTLGRGVGDALVSSITDLLLLSVFVSESF